MKAIAFCGFAYALTGDGYARTLIPSGEQGGA